MRGAVVQAAQHTTTTPGAGSLPHASPTDCDVRDLFDRALVDLDRWVLPTADDLAGLPVFFPAPDAGQTTLAETVYRDVDGRRLAYRVASIGQGIAPGRTFELELGLGGIRVRSRDLVREELAADRETGRRTSTADALAGILEDDGSVPDWYERPSAGVIREWSAKSRARMVDTFASIDYRPLHDLCVERGWTPGMITLTYPGRWQECAASGSAVKAHFQALAKRFTREFQAPFMTIWKLEFQRRGAPHFHLLAPIPAMTSAGETFETWLSITWADIVNAPDPIEKAKHRLAGTAVDFAAASVMTDAKRIAVYFAKHGTKTADDKEYQHIVPKEWQDPGAGPGRFWGYRGGLIKPTVIVELSVDDWISARRILRRVLAGRDRQIAYVRARHSALRAGATPAEATRAGIAATKTRRSTLGAGGQMTGGVVLVNDSLGLALDLARYLATLPDRTRPVPADRIPDTPRRSLARPGQMWLFAE